MTLRTILLMIIVTGALLLVPRSVPARLSEEKVKVTDTLLVLEDIVHPNGVYLFTHDDQQSLDYTFFNPSKNDFQAAYSLTICNHNNTQVKTYNGEFFLNSRGRCVHKLITGTSSLPYGVYYALLVVHDKNTGRKVMEKKTWFGVTSATSLRKAAGTEFLYGMDVSLPHFHKNPYLLNWMNFTGTDIIRMGVWDDSPEEFEEYYRVYKNHNLQVCVVYDPPKDSDSVQRNTKLEKICTNLENIARLHPGIKYYELGNEPDLNIFYPGPIEEYTWSFEQMYKAIKRGNANTTVMNGGLCFFGEEGFAKANKFVEIVNPRYIDAFAYHAHGYGSEAERAGYNNLKNAVKKWNKEGKPVFDTESGTPTVTAAQEVMQAATAVQKQVFAQSEGLGFLMWFRFLMFEEPYGNLFSEREPRPVVIAYRNMVEILRGYTFCKKIELGKKGSESYLFKELNGNSRIIISWVNEPVKYSISYKIAPDKSKAGNAEVIDIYGNKKNLEVLINGTVNTSIDENPFYIKWQAGTPDFEVEKANSVIEVQPEMFLGINNTNTIEFDVVNPDNKAIGATIQFKAEGSLPVYFEPAQIAATLNPNQKQTFKVSAIPQLTNQRVIWPAEWTVFTWLDNFNAEGLTQIPSSIVARDSQVVAQKVNIKNNIIDFAEVAGRWKEKALAVAFAEIYSYSDTAIVVGTAADWWMDIYVNGQPVYNTLKKGNEGTMSISEHVFKLPLRKGQNIIAAKVLSGLGGWKLAFANSNDLEIIQKKTKNCINIILESNNKIIATEKTLVEYINPVPFIHKHQNLTATKWDNEVITAQLKDKGVFNFHDKFPDNTKWWKGAADLSANVWVRQDKDNVHVVVKVTDDQYSVPAKRTGLINYDAVVLAFTGKDNEVSQYIITSLNQKPYVGKYKSHYLNSEAMPSQEIKANLKRESTVTWYTISIPKNFWAKSGNRINILVNDGDWGQRKQYIEWMPGLGNATDTSLWHKLML